jgi:hypothetical protein
MKRTSKEIENARPGQATEKTARQKKKTKCEIYFQVSVFNLFAVSSFFQDLCYKRD